MTTSSADEVQWVLRAQVGDREALEALLRAVQPPLQRYLASLAGAADAADLLQDTFILVIRKIGSLEDPRVFRAWTFRIASREAFRHIKRRRRWTDQHEDSASLEELPTPALPPRGDDLERLLAIDAISPASRAVLLLHFQQELPLPEVAAILGIPIGTAKSRLAYGLSAIRKYLKVAPAAPSSTTGESHGR
ncbi:MAG: RNA polymerase sigma factor [Vicinamibacterales bacterium]